MVKTNSNPHNISLVASHNSEIVDSIYPQIPKFIDGLREFWDISHDAVSYHLQDLPKIKGVFGGDLFPSHDSNIASTCGLYLDTIILTDPFMNSADLFSRWERSEAVRYLIKNALNVLKYQDLATAEVNPPIVAIIPFGSSVDSDQRDILIKSAEPDALAHAGVIFGTTFQSMEDLYLLNPCVTEAVALP